MLNLQPTACTNITHPKRPTIPPIACAEFSNPIPNPSDPFSKYLEINITLGPKKQAIPIPTKNLNIAICNMSPDNPETSAADDAIKIPKIAIFLEPCFAARIPAGT